ncbi:NAD-dependent protein deacetylase hst2-2 [Aspergillus mulundensis]|uniref:NAD-dependent protein deacetylase hst2-2 n=1 Tax=Aspergillus mulundensis TaxID=1810919 RepID=A0A3D8R4E2_9EURO|nr:NAD-dependent protein deacetylase hst2-2 [Aspergillus mulundensis]RDW68840.1 NAD-dependent protein deacetylase hst2-2 [Aspergillus mulundensis]
MSTTPSSPDKPTLSTITASIHRGAIKNIVVLVGAGLSTSSGLPDFRSPDTGLYAKLSALALPYPEAPFHISYFNHTPEPFYAIARARHPMNAKPAVGHAFLALLERRGMLGYIFSQNVDGLERDAGVSEEKVLNVHGSWKDQHCAILSGTVPICLKDGCGGNVKPDIVMFGESLPGEFAGKEEEMLSQADLLLVVGTSLKVAPLSEMPRKLPTHVPRVLVNREIVGDFGSRENDVLVLGDCDDGLREFARKLGLEEELEIVWKDAVKRKEAELERDNWDDGNAPTLEECVASAAEKMNMRMGVSEGHRRMLQGHLADKMAGIMAKRAQ